MFKNHIKTYPNSKPSMSKSLNLPTQISLAQMALYLLENPLHLREQGGRIAFVQPEEQGEGKAGLLAPSRQQHGE